MVWLALFVDVLALAVLTVVASLSDQESWTADILLNGFFLIPMLATTQLRPGRRRSRDGADRACVPRIEHRCSPRQRRAMGVSPAAHGRISGAEPRLRIALRGTALPRLDHRRVGVRPHPVSNGSWAMSKLRPDVTWPKNSMTAPICIWPPGRTWTMCGGEAMPSRSTVLTTPSKNRRLCCVPKSVSCTPPSWSNRVCGGPSRNWPRRQPPAVA